ncbi:MAG: hypothetical protein K2N89_14125 [Lachnospiraceae bacterium]|nr:hypothetical protein [Lachnospiraceae bacterium]
MKRYWFLLCAVIIFIVGATVNAKESRTVIVSVGDKEFEIILADNETADRFYEMLPMSLDMSELNGNEKYYYMNEYLPTSASVPKQIRTGDLMLYGSNCVVLFYKSFSTSYSYTELGHMINSSGLAAALGKGDVIVTFAKKDNVEEESSSEESNTEEESSTEESSSKEESSTEESSSEEESSSKKDHPKKSSKSEKKSHTYEWQITKNATATQNGEKAYVCTQCGEVAYRTEISAYGIFADTVIERIETAPTGSTLVIDAMQYVSFPKKVYEKLAERSDLTLEINFTYLGNAYTVTLPQNADLSGLIDQSGYCGFLNLCTRFTWSIRE